MCNVSSCENKTNFIVVTTLQSNYLKTNYLQNNIIISIRSSISFSNSFRSSYFNCSYYNIHCIWYNLFQSSSKKVRTLCFKNSLLIIFFFFKESWAIWLIQGRNWMTKFHILLKIKFSLKILMKNFNFYFENVKFRTRISQDFSEIKIKMSNYNRNNIEIV